MTDLQTVQQTAPPTVWPGKSALSVAASTGFQSSLHRLTQTEDRSEDSARKDNNTNSHQVRVLCLQQLPQADRNRRQIQRQCRKRHHQCGHKRVSVSRSFHRLTQTEDRSKDSAERDTTSMATREYSVSSSFHRLTQTEDRSKDLSLIHI